MSLRFEWDPAKDAANQRKHGVAFGEAQTTFYDEEAILIDDPEHSTREHRFVLLGMIALRESWWSATAIEVPTK